NVGGGKKEVLDSTPILPDILDLKRPTPPRLNKGGKKWQEEEIIDEIKEKAKIGPKCKRTKPILEDDLIDEEDLLDQGLGEISAAVQVSLSIARPVPLDISRDSPFLVKYARGVHRRPRTTKQTVPY
ncbi:MAG: hypothetical protein ACK5P3_19475, partial [Dolichospermum sp.]